MSDDHDDLRELLGAHVLGGLDPTDRHALEEHLPTCAECRAELSTYAVLPGLLRLGAPAGQTVEPDDAVLAHVVDAARRRRGSRRRRMQLLSAAAAVAIAATSGATVAALQEDTVPTRATEPGTRLVAAEDTAASGDGVLGTRLWGTAVDLELEGLPTGERFVVWVDADDGTSEQAATWRSTPSGRVRLSGACAIPRADAATLRVTTADGRLLLSAEV